jgi:hypothetical protein
VRSDRLKVGVQALGSVTLLAAGASSVPLLMTGTLLFAFSNVSSLSPERTSAGRGQDHCRQPQAGCQ